MAIFFQADMQLPAFCHYLLHMFTTLRFWSPKLLWSCHVYPTSASTVSPYRVFGSSLARPSRKPGKHLGWCPSFTPSRSHCHSRKHPPSEYIDHLKYTKLLLLINLMRQLQDALHRNGSLPPIDKYGQYLSVPPTLNLTCDILCSSDCLPDRSGREAQTIRLVGSPRDQKGRAERVRCSVIWFHAREVWQQDKNYISLYTI